MTIQEVRHAVAASERRSDALIFDIEQISGETRETSLMLAETRAALEEAHDALVDARKLLDAYLEKP